VGRAAAHSPGVAIADLTHKEATARADLRRTDTGVEDGGRAAAHPSVTCIPQAEWIQHFLLDDLRYAPPRRLLQTLKQVEETYIRV